MVLSVSIANRIGFTILGLTNNFAYVIMLSAAYDLLAQINNQNHPNNNATNTTIKPYCNEHSTSTILLADTLPSLLTKLAYPFLLVNVATLHKAIGTAFLSAISFIITGLSTSEVLIFTGVICASFSSGLGESTYLSNTPLYGDVSLTGWSIGTGAAGLLGSVSYALLTLELPIKAIMLIMLIVPAAMMFAFLFMIVPVHNHGTNSINANDSNSVALSTSPSSQRDSNADQERKQEEPIDVKDRNTKVYGANLESSQQNIPLVSPPLNSLKDKFLYLPSLTKYFLPLLLVYFGEYFINQGLFEIIYYPEITLLDHQSQYRWFQASYQLGVFISRSSLDLFKIKNLWAMSILQLLNAILFLAHTSKLIHIPSFYIVIVLIVYEGLLGGFTYVNTFYRVKKEVQKDRQEFSISAVTTADSLGIVIAALTALPVHNALCKLYM